MSEAKPRYRVPVSVQTGLSGQALYDGLTNLMTGSGTTIDPLMSNRWLRNILVDMQIEQIYRGSWMMRKIVDLPAYDMTREWRDWQGSADDIEAIEDEEERLRVKEKVRLGIIMGRLGGGALIMGTGQSLAEPIEPDNITKGGLKYLFPAPRSMLKPLTLVTDETDPEFGNPEFFELTLPNGQVTQVHISRMLIFKGLFHGNLSPLAKQEFWGDSVVSACMEAVNNAHTSMNEFASLISEAKIDLYKIPNLMQQAASADYEKKFMRRLELANYGKSNHRALIMDTEEDWEQRQLNLAGVPETIRIYIEIVCGAADIPATRFLGKSPDGMNSTGDSDQSNYEQLVTTKQENELRPILEKLDDVLIPSAGVQSREPGGDDSDEDEDDDIYFEFAPLRILSESDAADVENKEADTLDKLVTSGLFQDDALEEAFSNRMIESGRWPGYEAARKEAMAAAKAGPTEEDIAGVANPPAPGTPPGNTPPGGSGPTPPTVHVHVGGGSGATG